MHRSIPLLCSPELFKLVDEPLRQIGLSIEQVLDGKASSRIRFAGMSPQALSFAKMGVIEQNLNDADIRAILQKMLVTWN
ncbi:hypothetical protein SAMN05216228_10754 [Rhizobium tibeticum]|uniref:Uncharacterized protein n=1 Tax=Rhizobium tibeticum TaxID=501024 RepID=A0ABY1AY32_9HYPH|nr:hypothetical protein [Rhizobium tibeticum]SEP30203.1 hypothetical protein SAMN05216228_10754 [Rhizobium tibeticum]